MLPSSKELYTNLATRAQPWVHTAYSDTVSEVHFAILLWALVMLHYFNQI